MRVGRFALAPVWLTLLATPTLARSDDAATEIARGREALERRTRAGLEQGLAAFERATALDPQRARAWTGLADAASLLGLYGHRAPGDAFPRARDAAREALALDPELAEAHASLGLALYLYDRDFDAAEAAFRRAIGLAPGAAQVRHWYAMLLTASARGDEAVASMNAALAREPDSAVVNVKRATVLAAAGRTEEAAAQLSAAARRFPRLPLAHSERGFFELGRGDLEAARRAFEEAERLAGVSKATAALGAVAARVGRPQDAHRVLGSLAEQAERGWVPPLSFALVHANLGELDAAFAWVERALEAHDPGLVYLGVKPGFEPLRADPRFEGIRVRIGLPAR